MSTWTDIKNLIVQKLPDTGINVVSPKRMRDSLYAIIDQIIASTPDPIEFQWRATDDQGNTITYNPGDAVIDDNRWFIAKVQNSNKKPVLPDGSIQTTFWQEENASTTRYIDNWSPKLYTYPIELVIYNKQLLLLDRTVVGNAPFLSSDIVQEIADDKWFNLTQPGGGGGGIDPSNIVNDFNTDPADANKVAGANAVYLLFQALASNDVNYDTLQEVVDFIKKIDTDGELVAAIDAAVGNTLWRTGGSEEISFSSTVNLDNDQQVQHSVAGPIAYVLGSATHRLNKRRVDVIVANGVNKPTFDAPFTIVYDNYNNTAGVKNIITFQYIGDNEVSVYLQYVS